MARTQQEPESTEKGLFSTHSSEESEKFNEPPEKIAQDDDGTQESKGIVSAVPKSIKKRTIYQAKVATLKK